MAGPVMAEPEIRYAPGTIVARKYRVEGVIGAGGMGVVYKVTHENVDKVYAMKTLHRSLVPNRDLVARFFNEAKIHSKIDSAEDADVNRRQGHKHIARIYDCDTAEDGTPFYVMEFLHGASLRKVLWYGESRSFGIRRSLDIAISIFDALAYAHGKGVIHRDIKPDNIFIHTIGPFSEVKIVDFGIARILSSPAGTGERFLGTIAYSPREHLLGKPPTTKIDIYAATQVLFLMLVGKTPFAALRSEMALGQAILSNTPPIAPRLTSFGDFPEFLTSLVAAGLSHNADERPEAHVMARHLRNVKEELGIGDPIDVNATIEDLSTAVHTVVGEEWAPDPSSTDKERDREAIEIAATADAAEDGDTHPDPKSSASNLSVVGAPAVSVVAHRGATVLSDFVPPHAPSTPSINSSPPLSWEPPRSVLPEIDHCAPTNAALERALVAESHAPVHTAPMPHRPATTVPAPGSPEDLWAARGFVDAKDGSAARKARNDTEPIPIDFLAMLEQRKSSATSNALPTATAGTTPPTVIILEKRVPQRHIFLAAGTVFAVLFVGFSVTVLFFTGVAASKRAATRSPEVVVRAVPNQTSIASVTPPSPILEPEVPASSSAVTPQAPVPAKPNAPVKRIEVARPTPTAKSSNSDLEWRAPPPPPRKKMPPSGL